MCQPFRGVRINSLVCLVIFRRSVVPSASGHTPAAPEPLLCPERLLAELAHRGITEVLLDEGPRAIRARYATRREQRQQMHCPETLTKQQWEFADLQRYIVLRRPTSRR